MVDLVEQKLNVHYEESEMRFEVINTGISSYSFLLYYLQAKEILPLYSPDLVVINVDMTDVGNDCLYRRQAVMDDNFLPEAILADANPNLLMTPHGAMPKPIVFRFDEFFNQYSAAYRHIRAAFRKSAKESIDILGLPAVSKADKLPCDELESDWVTMHPWSDELKRNVGYSMFVLANTIKLLREQNVSVVVTGVPHFPQYARGYWAMLRSTREDPDHLPPHPKHAVGPWSTKPHDYLERTTEQASGLFLNSFEALKPYMINAKQTDYYYPNDPFHFNIAGNKIWAEAQFRFLLDSGILP